MLPFNRGLRETDTHIYFWGSYLSNFYWAPFNARLYGLLEADHEFKTSEHYFMACKAVRFDDMKTLDLILKAPDAKSAKALGKKVKGFDEKTWEEDSWIYMYDACLKQFSSTPTLRYNLVGTKEKILVEGSPIDKIWGVGIHYEDDAILDEKNWTGKNKLGDVLMKVRDVLASFK